MISLKTPYTPADVDFDERRLEALNAHFLRMMEADQIQSANYCLSRDGKVFANNALGKLSFRSDDARELRPDTMQWIASITKIFCSTAIFKLVEDGYIRPGQPVGDILKEMSVPPFNGITIAHLLSHTSGLPPDPGCFENKYAKSPWDYIGTMKDTPWLEAALSVGMRGKPGAEWAYCSFGFVLLGEIIGRVTGVRPEEYIEREILRPLGMTDTFFPNIPADTDDRKAKLTELAKRRNFRDEEDEEMAKSILAGNFSPPAEENPFMKVPSTGGGLISTAADLNRFGVMLLNQGTLDGTRILGRRTILRMTEMYTGPDIRDWCWGAGGGHRDYALGPDKRRTVDSLYSPSAFFHEGAGACCLIIDPEERMVASWFVPFTHRAWHAAGLFNAAAVMWSGLK